MRKVKLLFLVLLMLAFINGYAFAGVLRKAGDCKLNIADTFDKDKIFTTTLENSDIIAKCEFRGGDFFDKFAVFAVPSITNISGRPLRVSYQVAFFDAEENLIAVASQGADLEPTAKGFQLGSSMTKIPQDYFEKISAYKIVIYVNDK